MTRPSQGYERPLVDTADPRNVETDLSHHQSLITPTSDFFIRSHFTVPDVDHDAYRLVVEGLVNAASSLSLADLRAMSTDAATVTIECAGNGRAHLDPPVEGLPWVGGAVGTAVWGGVSLRRLLDTAGIQSDADRVVLRGEDRGEIATAGTERRTTAFERSLPLYKAREPGVLVATSMNGEAVPHERGGPARAIVAGWYGVASVKWLTRITAIRGDGGGHWETTEYAYEGTGPDGDTRRMPVTEMLPKAQIADPAPNAMVDPGTTIRVRGFAWAGEAAVAGVELSDDGGATWSAATLVDPPQPNTWTRWEVDWRPTRSGPFDLMPRCMDDRGRTQPMTRDPGRGTYMINEVIPYPITVRS